MENCIYLKRKIVNVNGKKYSNYFVNGIFNIRGEEIKKEIKMEVPKLDIGMYDVLDLVFGTKDEVKINRVARVSLNSATGRKTTSYRYEVYDEDSDLYGLVIPSGESNKLLLEKLYRDLNIITTFEEVDEK